jgi:hypothetical protein
LEGRVVDAETGAGLAGAEVFRTYDSRSRLAVMGEPSGDTIEGGWTTTDSQGRFEFKEEFRRLIGGAVINDLERTPFLLWIHPDYGWGFPELGYNARAPVEMRAKRDSQQISHFGNWKRRGSGPCTGFASDEALDRCYFIAYGSSYPNAGPR